MSPKCPLVEGYTSVVEWIDSTYESFKQQFQTTTLCTSLAYDLSRVEAWYYNPCSHVSTPALLEDPGAQTPLSFQMLLDELTWGRYRGQPLLTALQLLLLPVNGRGRQTTHPQPPPPGSANPGGTHQGRGNGRDREPIANPHPITCLHILQGENTQNILRTATLPTITGYTFYKYWYLGVHYFSQCTRVASHIHPSQATIDTVVPALAVERLTAVAATNAAAARE